MGNKLDVEIGSKYGRLKIVSLAENVYLPCGQPNRMVNCVCDCGNTKQVRLLHLLRGRISSCGCIKNAMNGKSETPIGQLFKAMKFRCGKYFNVPNQYYNLGIEICKEWMDDFDKFETWCNQNGFDKSLQIDRIDNTKGYSPDNCRFVTSKINNNNRGNTMYVWYKGEKIAFMLLLDKLKLTSKHNTIRNRILRGWTVEDAIDTPIKKGNYFRRNN